MKWTNLLLGLIFFIGLSNCWLQCNPNDNCECSNGQSDIELHCPKNSSEYGGFLLIHITKDTESHNEDILIDCVNATTMPLGLFSNSDDVKTLASFDMDWLPNMPIEKIAHFEIRYCPLPNTTFRSIIDKFSVKELKSLYIVNGENLALKKPYFEHLETIETLKLDVPGGVLNIEENVFNNTPNLVSLDIKGDKLELAPNVFQSIPLLKSVDISQSNLNKLPEGIFWNLKNLEILSLWSNELTEIDETVFSDLDSLVILELSYNKISSIHENAFKNLIHLNAAGLARNNLTTLSSNLFQNNQNLSTIKMYENYYLDLPDYLFANLNNLKDVSLSNCKLKVIPEHVFENSTNIKSLELDNNLLTYLPETVFKGLINLEKLDLQNNKIENITNILAYPRNIKKLNLANNLITSIEKDTLINLSKLEEINLRKNKISQIHYLAFNHENLAYLKIIDLSHNQISEPYGSFSGFTWAIFQNTISLTTVNLSHNQISNIDDVINLENKLHLRLLDLRHNAIAEVVVRNLLTLLPSGNKLEVKLDSNNITNVNFYLADSVGPEEDLDAYHNKKFAYTVISIGNNPIRCDCTNYDLFRYFHDSLSPKLKVLFDIKAKNATCTSPYDDENYSVSAFPLSLAICPLNEIIDGYNGCPENCLCYWKPFDRSIIVDGSFNNFTTLPEIVLPKTRSLKYEQIELNFDHNNLIEGPKTNMTGYNYVTKMVLSNNRIKTIPWLPPKLQVLKLHNNSVSKLSFEVFNILNSSTLLNVTLTENPWNCDCSAENLTNLLRQKRYIDGRHVYCVNSTTPLMNLGKKDLCAGSLSIFIVIVPVMSILLILAIVAALYYRYQQEIKVWLFAKNLCLWWVTEEDLDKDKIYDAFISYSHKDEDFVNQNLLPVLEGKEGYKLCVHYRNWIPGEFIAKQVTSSVCESRRTIIVLSNNFLESVWGKLEFRTAHTQAMTEGRARVIVILYGDVDLNSLDNELKMYLKTNTYVKWDDQYFWDKLKYALPHSHKKISNSQKHANIMNFIDDKFKLVTPVTTPPSPGTTPPVLSLNPSLLKKHPLSFVPSTEMDTPPAEAGTLLTVTSS